MFAWFDKLSHTGQKFMDRMSERGQPMTEEGRRTPDENAEALESSSGLGRISQSGQRLWHRVSTRTQLWSEEGRSKVLETVEGGREAVQSAAVSVLSTLATPVAWTDDVLGHRIGVLGWTREHLNQLAQELEPTHEGAGAAEGAAEAGQPGGGAAAEQVAQAAGERRRYDRRQYVREGSGRRASDRLMKERLEEVVPRQVAPKIDTTPSSPMAAVKEELTVTEVLATPSATATVTATPGAAGTLPGQEPVTASVAEVMASHPRKKMAIPDYDELNVHKIVAALRRMNPKQVPPLLAYEKANKNRKSIIDVMEKILARQELAK